MTATENPFRDVFTNSVELNLNLFRKNNNRGMKRRIDVPSPKVASSNTTRR